MTFKKTNFATVRMLYGERPCVCNTLTLSLSLSLYLTAPNLKMNVNLQV